MAVSYVGGGANTATGASVAVAHSTAAAGDLMLAVVAVQGNTSGDFPSDPAGWALVKNSSVYYDQPTNGIYNCLLYRKVAAGGENSLTVTKSGTAAQISASVAIYRGAAVGVSAAQSNSAALSTSHTAPSLTNADAGAVMVVAVGVNPRGADTAETGTSQITVRQWSHAASNRYCLTAIGDQFNIPTGATGARSMVGASAYSAGISLLLSPTNTAPNAPILTAPADGATIDLNAVQRFALTPSDPDAGDSTSQTWWRHRLIGAPAWTTVTQTSPLTYIDFAAGTFAAGDYEWQAATRDAQGAPTNDSDLKWSTSSFFTAADAPAAPTITAPVNGATVTSTADVTWSTPSQGSYQLRRVRDNAGAADTATVYYDTGEVVTTTARSRPVTFETNNRYEHIQVRIKVDGLWSSWASVRVNVSYTPPTVPVVTLTPDAATGSLLVGITNPAPGAGVPATSYNDVYVDDGDGEERRATMLASNSTWTYWTPKSGRDYDGKVRVVAVGSNGTTASS